MKKLLALLAVVVLAAGLTMNLNAQAKAVYRVADGEHLVKFPVVSTDILDDSTEYILKEFDLTRKNKVQYYTIPVYVDLYSRTAADSSESLTILSQYSFDNTTWSNIDTVTYYGIGRDSTFNFQDITTGTSAPYMRVKFGPILHDSVGIQVDAVWGRFLDK